MKPRIGLLLGDPCGIGPEIVVKLLSRPEMVEQARVIVVGDHKVYQRGEKAAGYSLDLPVVSDINAIDPAEKRPIFLDYSTVDLTEAPPGQVSVAAGRSVLQTLTLALQLAQAEQIDAICFAPLNKQAMHLAGNPFSDEMRFFAHILEVEGPIGEINVIDNLWISRVTSHIPLSEVSRQVTTANVLKVIRLTYQTLQRAGFARPRILVAALNPHAGEGGVFGREEIDAIGPAVALAREEQIEVEGPLPADIVFPKVRNEGYNGVVTMYHDQGLIALKLLDFERGATVHGGLPLITTTTVHGTAFDIVGQGKASTGSLEQAFKVACQMAKVKPKL
jgi:4-hydroxythreonine-4-phosphate dehydrogenase